LADVIRRNTTDTNLQGNVFFFRVEISGTAFGDRNRDGRLGPGERGLAGQTVELRNADTDEVVATATTDARGTYRFDVASGLGLGRFQVSLALPDGLVQTAALPVIALTRGDSFVRHVDLGVALTQVSGGTASGGWDVPSSYPRGEAPAPASAASRPGSSRG